MQLKESKNPQPVVSFFDNIAGGLGLFLYAINNLSGVLKDLLDGRTRKLPGKFTHMLFNGPGVVLFLPLARYIEKLLMKWIPDKVKTPARRRVRIPETA